MSVLHHRLVMAGVITAAVIAVPAAALASASGSPSGKTASPQASAAGAARSKAGHAGAAGSKVGHASAAEAALAASAGISPARLQAGLIAAKRAGGGTTGGIAAFAAATGVSHATAQRIMHAMVGAQAGHSLISAASVRVLATRLGVSTSAAHRALQRVGALSGSDGIDPASPAFAAIAHDLGVSPAKLISALGAVKQSMAPR